MFDFKFMLKATCQVSHRQTLIKTIKLSLGFKSVFVNISFLLLVGVNPLFQQKFGENLRNLESEFHLLCAKIPSQFLSKLRYRAEANSTLFLLLIVCYLRLGTFAFFFFLFVNKYFFRSVLLPRLEIFVLLLMHSEYIIPISMKYIFKLFEWHSFAQLFYTWVKC